MIFLTFGQLSDSRQIPGWHLQVFTGRQHSLLCTALY